MLVFAGKDWEKKSNNLHNNLLQLTAQTTRCQLQPTVINQNEYLG